MFLIIPECRFQYGRTQNILNICDICSTGDIFEVHYITLAISQKYKSAVYQNMMVTFKINKTNRLFLFLFHVPCHANELHICPKAAFIQTKQNARTVFNPTQTRSIRLKNLNFHSCQNDSGRTLIVITAYYFEKITVTT